MGIIDEIKALKAEKNALILAHNYVRPEIQELADFTGDSLELSMKARSARAKLMVFCGVRFMAETAKLLSPESTVLLPNPDADCPMARMADGEQVKAWRSEFPDAVFAAYVNTTAETKAQVDICCTSGNAEKVVRSLEGRKIVFLPDRNLGRNVMNALGRKMELWPGYCPVHNNIDVKMLEDARRLHPGAAIMVHPECGDEVVKNAEYAMSTGAMLRFLPNAKEKEFIVGTEEGILHRMRKENPDKIFHPLLPQIVCPDMKKITLEDVLKSLKEEVYEVKLTVEMMDKARKCIENMLAVK